MTDILDHAGLKALAKELGRPLFTLEVTLRDPFTAGVRRGGRRPNGLPSCGSGSISSPALIFGVFIICWLSQAAGAVLMPDGSPYLNLDRPCFDLINTASLDARHLGLVSAYDLVDRRNDEPVIYLPAYASDAELTITGGLGVNELNGFDIPALDLDHAENLAALSRRNLVRKDDNERRAVAAVPAIRHQLDHGLGRTVAYCVRERGQARIGQRAPGSHPLSHRLRSRRREHAGRGRSQDRARSSYWPTRSGHSGAADRADARPVRTLPLTAHTDQRHREARRDLSRRASAKARPN